MKIGFIGAGTVGTALAVTLKGKGHDIVAVQSRTRASAERLAQRVGGAVSICWDGQEVAEAADIVFITTPDDAIAKVAGAVDWLPTQGVVHCSGALSLEALEAARKNKAEIGSFHPLQTFASVEQALANLPGSTFALEGRGDLLNHLKRLAEDLGGAAIVLRPGDKVLYHAAAVMACNYAVTLMSLATDLWKTFRVETPEATKALLPLLQGTVNNLQSVGLPGALTGPIARGDIGTIEKHLAALKEKAPELLSTYRELGLKTIPVALAKGKLDGARAEELRRLLSPTVTPAGR